ncbi:hypothetical protein CMUS01_04101 [Colletotrichum musicola]|uniref:Uncharacterized protein n=1 Tax=Colletotrichum musicola TaxID=2175873 RepID=A0A8H6U147_9PEZI|nr:hypothetical protein CMUS01_04101 [Colletotrichum musicola]
MVQVLLQPSQMASPPYPARLASLLPLQLPTTTASAPSSRSTLSTPDVRLNAPQPISLRCE